MDQLINKYIHAFGLVKKIIDETEQNEWGI